MPDSPFDPSPDPSTGVVGGAAVGSSLASVSRRAFTTRRSAAEYFGWQVVSVRVGSAVASSTSTALGFTTKLSVTRYVKVP
ncbi:MAG: hypothetical protein M5U14_00420 [Acidimicrobiia bacterium]|nr:hypothetical protein [Acidimicrobiia bacterium]